MSEISRLPLFVFGTLRRGQSNHHLLAGRYLKVLSSQLRDFARTHPLMIEEQTGGIVEGEVYFLREETYAQTLRQCDDLEGIPAGTTVGEYYKRIQLIVNSTAGSHIVWAYVHPATADRE
jgi:gamma-glutamylcyclotransferase (GGCT)/AIG2-like uncharacterized protein YtfP